MAGEVTDNASLSPVSYLFVLFVGTLNHGKDQTNTALVAKKLARRQVLNFKRILTKKKKKNWLENGCAIRCITSHQDANFEKRNGGLNDDLGIKLTTIPENRYFLNCCGDVLKVKSNKKCTM